MPERNGGIAGFVFVAVALRGDGSTESFELVT